MILSGVISAAHVSTAYAQSQPSDSDDTPTASAPSSSSTPSASSSASPPDSSSGASPRSSPDTGLRSSDPGVDNYNQLPNTPDSITPPRPKVPFSATNYGKPRKMPDKRLVYKGRPKTLLRGALPPLVPYPGSAQAKRPVDPIASPPPPPPTVAQQPAIARKKRPILEETPYAPTGVDVGSLRLTPFVEVSGGYDTNPNRGADVNSPKGSSLIRTDVGVAAQSNWSNHSLSADIKAGYSRYTATPEADRPDGSGTVKLRLDATRDTTLNFELRGALTTQRPGTPGLPTSLDGRPLVATYGASAGATQKLGRLEVTVTGLADRTSYQDGRLINGTSAGLSAANYNAYGLRGRVGYELTPGITPFVEVTADTRVRDMAIDPSGFARNSNGVKAVAGSTFELSRTLTGTVSAGYAQRKYDDARLPNLGGPAIDASLVWTATPLTTVTLRGTTDFIETTLANASGAISRTGQIEISHALLRNLTIGATASLSNNQYRGVDITENYYGAGLKAEYSLTRSIAVKGSYNYERLKSSVPGSDYTANVFMLGLRLQR
jgi:hypothetical protein